MAVLDTGSAQNAAALIRDETVDGANTAARVGGLLFDIAESVPFTGGVLTHAGLAGPYNDYNVSPIHSAFALRFSSSSVATFSGIVSQPAGAMRLVCNVGTLGTLIQLLHDSSLSLAENRILLPNEATLQIGPWQAVLLWYDATSARWRAVDQVPVSVAPMLSEVLASGDYTGGSDIVLSTGNALRGEDSEFSGGAVQILGGTTAVSANGDGGDILLTPGAGKGTGVAGKIFLDGKTDAGGFKVENVGAPTATTDAATKAYVDSHSAAGAGFGPFASRPVPGTAGRLYYATDSAIAQWVDDGTAWRPIVGGVVGKAPPTLAAFNAAWTAYNLGTASMAAGNGVLVMRGPNDAAVNTSRGWSIPTSDPAAWVEVALDDSSLRAGGITVLQHFGIGFRNSVGGAQFTLTSVRNNGVDYYTAGVIAGTWSSDTARTATQQAWFASLGSDANGPTFFRVRKSGTNLIAEVSRDRQNWQQLHSILTSLVNPTHITLVTHCQNFLTSACAIIKHLDWLA